MKPTSGRTRTTSQRTSSSADDRAGVEVNPELAVCGPPVLLTRGLGHRDALCDAAYRAMWSADARWARRWPPRGCRGSPGRPPRKPGRRRALDLAAPVGAEHLGDAVGSRGHVRLRRTAVASRALACYSAVTGGGYPRVVLASLRPAASLFRFLIGAARTTRYASSLQLSAGRTVFGSVPARSPDTAFADLLPSCY